MSLNIFTMLIVILNIYHVFKFSAAPQQKNLKVIFLKSYIFLKFISKHFILIIVILNGILSSVLSSNRCSSWGKEFSCNAGDPSLIPGLWRSPGEGISYPLQYSWASVVSQMVESACDVGDLGSIPGKASGFFTTEPLGNAGGVSLIPGPGRSLGGGHGNPLQ